MHAGFFGGSSAFQVIAFETAGDDIFPGLYPSFDIGYYVVESQVFRGTLPPAVLACMAIPGINVRSAELYVLKTLSDLYIFEKSEDTGHLDGETDASDLAIIFGQYFNFALIKQSKRALPGDNVYRFVGCVQYQRMFHSSALIGKRQINCSMLGLVLISVAVVIAQAEIIQI